MPLVPEFHILSWGVTIFHSPLCLLVDCLSQLDREGSIYPGSWLFPWLTINIECSFSVGTKAFTTKDPLTGALLRNYCIVEVSILGVWYQGCSSPGWGWAAARLRKGSKNQPEAPSLLCSFSRALTVVVTPDPSPCAWPASWILFILLLTFRESPLSHLPKRYLSSADAQSHCHPKVQGAPIFSMSTPEEAAEHKEPHP